MKVTATSSNVASSSKDASAALVPERRHQPGSDAMNDNHRPAPPVQLTPRQMEVFLLLCEGLSNKLIGRKLNISQGTVKVHVSFILREFGVTSRLQAVVAAQRCGLLDEFAVSTSGRATGLTPAGYPMIAAGDSLGTSRKLAVAA